MIPDLFDALGQLADDVGRPALLEDRSHGVLAYSRHTHVTDHVREQTILGQRAPAEVRRWLAQYHLRTQEGPVRLPANPELRMLPRICLPIRVDDQLLGFLWFIEGPDAVGPDVVELARSRLPSIAELLLGQQLSSRTQLEPLLQQLLAGTELHPDDEEICSSAGLGPTDPVRVLAVTGRHPAGQPWPPILESLARQAGASTVVNLLAGGVGAVVVAGLTRRLEPPLLGGGLGMGLGDEVASITHLREAHRSAVDAATCAAVFDETGGFLDWAQAGLHRMVPVLARYQPDTTVLTGVDALLADPRTAPLARSATVYLDLAGNVQATAAALHLHRTSLYYRLERFEALTGVDLRDGTQRTAVHLALKVAAFQHATGHS